MSRMTIKEASKEMGISEQFLRVMIRKGKFSWGTAEQINEGGRWTYFINREGFLKYMRGE